MATLKDLFKSKKNELYGLSDNIRITSLGLINPPRGAALLTSSPDALADLIGNQIGGALGGSANRPTDTIFDGPEWTKKPISLFKTRAGLQTAVDGAKKDYYIKDNPAPASLFARYKQGATSPLDMALNLAKDGINKLGGKKGKANALKEALNKRNEAGEGYGTKYRKLDIGGKPLQEEHKFSKWYPQYVEETGANGKNWIVSKLEERAGVRNRGWDDANDIILRTTAFADEKAMKEAFDLYPYANQVWVSFKKYGTTELIPFVGSISGLSEDLSPEWSDFKYVGSPFKVYKYSGVERSIKFDLKLYYKTEEQKKIMIKKINFLKSLVFPYDDVVKATYNGLDENNSPLSFAPNLVYLNIDGLYADVLGIVDSLSFSIDETTTWSNFNPNMESGKLNKLYPSVINVSYSMKIIEQHMTKKEGTVTKYKYNFDGYNSRGDEYINTTTIAKDTQPVFNANGTITARPIKIATPNIGLPAPTLPKI